MNIEPTGHAPTASGHHRTPLIARQMADLDTPLALYLKLCGPGGSANTFLMESVVGGERFGRYSFIGLPARTVLRVQGRTTTVHTDGREVARHVGDPLAFTARFHADLHAMPPPGLPRFCGGLVGAWGYDLVRLVEPRLAAGAPPDDLGLPDATLMLCDELAVVDNVTGTLSLIVWIDAREPGARERGQARLAELQARVRAGVAAPPVPPRQPESVERPFAKADFMAAVRRAQEAIAAGDCMQIVMGQRLQRRFAGEPLALYRALRMLNPSPYLFYYDFGDTQVVGASPEILVRQERTADGRMLAAIRPLAGTRHRGATPEEDARLEAELRADPKERAEHLMLIDLARNDLGRLAEAGSVRVSDAFGVERYSHVMHMVSHVEATLKPGTTAMDVLRATFPAGTLSGAPKVMAMQWIDRLEPVKRGLYGGACGYWSYSGDMDLAIAIRTGILHGGMLYVQAAAGVVADSQPEAEWQETEAKARALLRAAEMVDEGF